MKFFTLSEKETLKALGASENGLSAESAAERLASGGRNVLQTGKKKSALQIFLAQFTDLMIWILLAAAVISALLGEAADMCIILIVVVVNAVLGTVQESRAEAALEALKKMAAPSASVIRGGRRMRVPADEIVPGDVVNLEAGDGVPADLRLLECHSLQIDESALTGESVPSEKISAKIDDPNAPLGDRLNMAYMGTAVTYGRGTGVAVQTGMATEMGAIAEQLGNTESEPTPLQKTLNKISTTLSIGVLAIAAVVFALNLIIKGIAPHVVSDSFLLAVSLAVAAIPEGMVAVVTVVLALGMSRMARRGAIIRRLPAVETLGSTQVICSDKTGTLTQNKMTVTETHASDRELLHGAMLHCNDATLTSGDPTERALLDYLVNNGVNAPEDMARRTRAGEVPFDSVRKRSTVAVKSGAGVIRVFVKGAVDTLLPLCVNPPREVYAQADEMAKKALRVLAYAYRDVHTDKFENIENPESNLTFIGLTGMIDPARPEAKEAIALCKSAGIVPVMITGDHKITASAIAEDLGLLGGERRAVTGNDVENMTDEELVRNVDGIAVYARVAPEHKVRIVRAWRSKGKVVSMTGDGVNDAPALKAADIGVGMGITGTDVAKGASDMVLTDDNFATIVAAVGEGRRIFDNIHKTVRFLLSSNAGEVLAILTATLLNIPLLAAIHILWVNLVTDTFPALALGLEPAEDDIMERKPRDQKTPFFSGREWLRVALVGAAEAALTLTAYIIGNNYSGAASSHELGTTMAFLTLSLAQLFAAVGFQSERHSVFSMKPGKHKFLWLAFAGSGLLQVVVVLFAPLRSVFRLAPLSGLNWIQVAALCLIMLLFIEGQKLAARLSKKE